MPARQFRIAALAPYVLLLAPPARSFQFVCQDGSAPTCADGSVPRPPTEIYGRADPLATCPAACNVFRNRCDPTTAPTCIYPDPRVVNARAACACRPGYKAAAADSDTTKHWRLPVAGQEHRTWVAEGVPCDTLCKGYGAQSCMEVTILGRECIGGAEGGIKNPGMGGVYGGEDWDGSPAYSVGGAPGGYASDSSYTSRTTSTRTTSAYGASSEHSQPHRKSDYGSSSSSSVRSQSSGKPASSYSRTSSSSAYTAPSPVPDYMYSPQQDSPDGDGPGKAPPLPFDPSSTASSRPQRRDDDWASIAWIKFQDEYAAIWGGMWEDLWPKFWGGATASLSIDRHPDLCPELRQTLIRACKFGIDVQNENCTPPSPGPYADQRCQSVPTVPLDPATCTTYDEQHPTALCATKWTLFTIGANMIPDEWGVFTYYGRATSTLFLAMGELEALLLVMREANTQIPFLAAGWEKKAQLDEWRRGVQKLGVGNEAEARQDLRVLVAQVTASTSDEAVSRVGLMHFVGPLIDQDINVWMKVALEVANACEYVMRSRDFVASLLPGVQVDANLGSISDAARAYAERFNNEIEPSAQLEGVVINDETTMEALVEAYHDFLKSKDVEMMNAVACWAVVLAAQHARDAEPPSA